MSLIYVNINMSVTLILYGSVSTRRHCGNRSLVNGLFIRRPARSCSWLNPGKIRTCFVIFSNNKDNISALKKKTFAFAPMKRRQSRNICDILIFNSTYHDYCLSYTTPSATRAVLDERIALIAFDILYSRMQGKIVVWENMFHTRWSCFRKIRVKMISSAQNHWRRQPGSNQIWLKITLSVILSRTLHVIYISIKKIYQLSYKQTVLFTFLHNDAIQFSYFLFQCSNFCACFKKLRNIYN